MFIDSSIIFLLYNTYYTNFISLNIFVPLFCFDDCSISFILQNILLFEIIQNTVVKPTIDIDVFLSITVSIFYRKLMKISPLCRAR